jgi:hypothetical protein
MGDSLMKKQEVGDRQIHTPTYNAMIDACKTFLAMKFDGKFFVTQTGPNGKFVSMRSQEGLNQKEWLFGLDYDSRSYTVYEGKIQIKGTWYTIAEKTENFSGTPVYIFVNFNRNTGAGEIQQANSIQGNTTSNMFWMLAEFVGAAGVYSLVKRYHIGAIQVDLPL